jgi:hypothetical protein
MSIEELKTAATEAMQRATELTALVNAAKDATDAAYKADRSAAYKALTERLESGVYTPEELTVNKARKLYYAAAAAAVSIAKQLGVMDTWRTYAEPAATSAVWHAEAVAAWTAPLRR